MTQHESEALKNAFEQLPTSFKSSEGTDVRLISLKILEAIVEKFGDLRYTEGVINGHKSSAEIITNVMDSVFKKPITETPTLP